MARTIIICGHGTNSAGKGSKLRSWPATASGWPRAPRRWSTRAFTPGPSSAIWAIRSRSSRWSPPDAAVLVTGGGIAFYVEPLDRMIIGWHMMGIALSKAAQHKLTCLLHYQLGGEGIYVGEVMVMGPVKGTAFDHAGTATIDAAAVAELFWTNYQGRSELSVQIGG